MIKYFCDRCGKELKKNNPNREVLFLTCVIRYYIPKEWDGKSVERVLCNNCLLAFDNWLDELKKETDA